MHESTVRPLPRYGRRGRPRQGAQPEQVLYHLDGALASRLATRQARVDQHSGFILATNELEDAPLSPQSLLEDYKGQGQAERGLRFLKDPQFLASSFSLKKPERIMALLMVMTVCRLVYAALEYRIRQALKAHDATFPNRQGNRCRTRRRGGSSTILWGFMYSSSLGSGAPWCSISPRSTRSCSSSLENLMKDFIAEYSQKRKRHCGMPGHESPASSSCATGIQSDYSPANTTATDAR